MDEARKRLADAINEQRIELRLRWQELAARAEISTTHLQRIRGGSQPLTAEVKVGLEDALGWKRGSIDAVLDGGEPIDQDTEVDERPEPTTIEELLDQLRRIEELLREKTREEPPEDRRKGA